MSPGRVPGSQNFRFNRKFPEPVGRIQNSSGTSDPGKFREYDLLLTKLWRNDQVDALLAVKRGEISMAEIAEVDREMGLAKGGLLARLALRKPLWRTIDELLPKPPLDQPTRRRYWDSLRALRRTAPYLVRRGPRDERLGDGARVGDLRRVDWPRLQRWWLAPEEEGGAGRSGTDWMHLRRAVSWLLTQVLGDAHHTERRAIMALIPTAAEHEREPELTPAEFWDICEMATPPVAAAFVTLVVTGMRMREYELCRSEHLRPASYQVVVPGRKTKKNAVKGVVTVAREYWPYVEAAIPPKRRRLAIYRAFKKGAREIGKPELTVHDLRHCFVQWGLDEGATIPAAQKAARHSDVRMTLRYAARAEKGEMGEAVGRALSKGRKQA